MRYFDTSSHRSMPFWENDADQLGLGDLKIHMCIDHRLYNTSNVS